MNVSKYGDINYSHDCKKNCNWAKHGLAITRALTKRSIGDEELATYIAATCSNFANVLDPQGRSAIHIAASVGRYAILEWLLNQGANINQQDRECGSTALHRALYYGFVDCAVLLLRYGANTELLEADKTTALQYCSPFRAEEFLEEGSNYKDTDVLVWGSNSNNNLGTDCNLYYPQHIDMFLKNRIYITHLSINTYHSIFVDMNNNLYVVGHGTGGRLGHGSEDSLTTPTKIDLQLRDEKIISVSVSKKHSLVLTDRGTIFCCGLNDDKQLGIMAVPPMVTKFERVDWFLDPVGLALLEVFAKDKWSMTYSHDKLYVWGTNCGQCGSYHNLPYSIAPLNLLYNLDILYVAANDSAIVYSSTLNIGILHNNKHQRISLPVESDDIKNIAVAGDTNLKFVVLTYQSGPFIWFDDSQMYIRCENSGNCPIAPNDMTKILYTGNQVLLLANSNLYKGYCRQMQSNMGFSSIDSWTTTKRSPVSKTECIDLQLTQMSSVDRVLTFYANDDFTCFALLQERSVCELYPPKIDEEYTFSNLLQDTDAFDEIHDVVFHVEGRKFYGHKLIVYSRSEGLRTIIESSSNKNVFLDDEGLTEKMFDFFLKFIYTNFCSTIDIEEIQRRILDFKSNDVVFERFRYFTQKFKLNDLDLITRKSKLDLKKIRKPLRFPCFPNLCDAIIECGDDGVFRAHKCLLITRSEFFRTIFCHNWSTTAVDMKIIPIGYMRPILEYLYSLDEDNFRNQNYSERYLYNMITFCEQFGFIRLRQFCEVLLLEKLTVSKCADMLVFADMYNCNYMKKECLEFICRNLYRVIVHRSLESCEPVFLKEIRNYYLDSSFRIKRRRGDITPDANAISDDDLLEFIGEFRVDLSEKLHKEYKSKKKSTEYKHDTRRYEQQAIKCMAQLNTQDCKQEKLSNELNSSSSSEGVGSVSEKKSLTWTTVSDKKDVKKKLIVTSPNINKIMENEPKPKEGFVVLTPDRKIAPANTTCPRENTISIGDFLPLDNKLQTRKKRLHSVESSSDTGSPTKPISIPKCPKESAWKINSPPQSSNQSDANSFAEIIKSPTNEVQETSITPKLFEFSLSKPTNSFSQILDEEKKLREYQHEISHKSLALTQIEETAIAELRAFYNADDIEDEIITVERKTRAPIPHFNTWKKT